MTRTLFKLGGDSEIMEATRITVGACDFCDAVHINFLDADGEIFATASLPVALESAFLSQFNDCVAKIRARPYPAPAGRQ